MEVVLDFNVAFSALHSRGVAHRLFAVNYIARQFNFLVPEFFWEELYGHMDRLVRLTRLDRNDLEEMLSLIRSQTTVVPFEWVEERIEEARAISPDPYDVLYVATVLATGSPLLTGDKRLISALGEQGLPVMTLSEEVELLFGGEEP
jgi:predicted nucleic acid-binding protein